MIDRNEQDVMRLAVVKAPYQAHACVKTASDDHCVACASRVMTIFLTTTAVVAYSNTPQPSSSHKRSTIGT